MNLGQYLETLGFRRESVMTVSLATDGYSPAKHNLLMVVLQPLDMNRPQDYRFVAGGNVGATQEYTNIPEITYAMEARRPEAVGEWLCEQLWQYPQLVSHSAYRFTKPFLEPLMNSCDAEGLEWLDTMLLSQAVVHDQLAGSLQGNNLAQFFGGLAISRFPRQPSVSLDSMVEYYGIRTAPALGAMIPQQKALQTAALLNHLLEEEI